MNTRPALRGSRARALILPSLVTLAGVAILVALGVWQLERLAWKTALIERVEARLDAPRSAAPGPAEWADLDIVAREYEPIAVSGTFDHAGEVHVVITLTQPKGPAGGIGYLVMTPLTTDQGWTIYVNRGFVPRERVSLETRQDGLVDGETAVTGLLRAPRRRAWFMPGDDAAGNEWLSRDPLLYVEMLGLPGARVAPYVVDADFDPDLPGGLPQGGETVVDFPNNHLGYALTWFGLAAALAAVFVAFVVARTRGQGADGSSS
ncbi:MAG: SURF1 family protein [Dongiaceae bacterium]